MGIFFTFRRPPARHPMYSLHGMLPWLIFHLYVLVVDIWRLMPYTITLPLVLVSSSDFTDRLNRRGKNQ